MPKEWMEYTINQFWWAQGKNEVGAPPEIALTRPMQRTAKARFFLFFVLPATVIRVSTACAGRRQILGGMFCVESSRMALDSRAAANWQSLEGSLNIIF